MKNTSFIEYIASTVFTDYNDIKEQAIISIIVSVFLIAFCIFGSRIANTIFADEFIAYIMSNAIVIISKVAIASIWLTQGILCVMGYTEKINKRRGKYAGL